MYKSSMNRIFPSFPLLYLNELRKEIFIRFSIYFQNIHFDYEYVNGDVQ